MPATLHAADVVCPLTTAPVADGGVLVDAGRVAAVGARTVLEDRAALTVAHRGVLLPGLVDACTRAEEADVRRLGADADAGDWDAERWSRSAHRGAHELLRAGVTVACDLVRRGPGAPALARSGIAGDSLVLLSEVGAADAEAVLAAIARTLARPAGERRVGVAVDVARVAPPLLAGAAALAAERAAPFHAELGDAPLDALVDADALRRGVRVAGAPRTPADADRLAAAGAVAVWTPAAPPAADVAALAAAEAPLVLGGDGVPDPLAVAAAWHEAARAAGVEQWPVDGEAVPLVEAAVQLASDAGARVLGHGEQVGLEPGRRADFCVVDAAVDPAAPYEGLLAAGPGRQVLTVIAGVRRARRASADAPWPALGDHRVEGR